LPEKKPGSNLLLAIFGERSPEIGQEFFHHAKPDIAAHGNSEADGPIPG
jgi:hypothetical protein